MPDLLGLVETTLRGAPNPQNPSAATESRKENTPVTVDTLQRPAKPATPEKGAGTPLPPWLQDVNRAAQHLTRLSLETAAQAALITRGDQLYAYAGGYPQNVAHELADAVSHYWGRQGGIDLARFIRLETTGEEYMLYATALPGEMVLSLVFDAKTPFSQIRTQANQLAQRLASGPKEETNMNPPASDAPPSQPLPAPSKPQTPPRLPSDWLSPPTSSDASLQSLDDDIPADWQPTQPPSGDRRSFLDHLLPDMLPSVPLPYEDDADNCTTAYLAALTPSFSSLRVS